MLQEWLTAAVVTFVGLLPIANPFSTAVVFLTITDGFGEARRQQQARLACIYMACVLWVFLVAGALIMSFFGISIPGVRIAGGLIVARVGFGMLHPQPEAQLSPEVHEEASHMRDVAFTPLAMPMLSGPGSIAVTISMASQAETLGGNLAIAAGIALVAFVSFLVLRASERVVGFLGATGMQAMSRIMGFLLVCVGIQFMVVGVHEILVTPKFIDPIVEAIRSAR